MFACPNNTLSLCWQHLTYLSICPQTQVVATLKDLASSGHTVVCSIHQPRSSIFGMFDDLMLLSEGHCVYFGPAEGVLDYFEKVGTGRACVNIGNIASCTNMMLCMHAWPPAWYLVIQQKRSRPRT